ncbi:MAG: TVP38/TMEM64 family protein [Planctomycetes bacterium]|nr:TVP38/TMEM64 family protein [Planctomycetota bacterium]
MRNTIKRNPDPRVQRFFARLLTREVLAYLAAGLLLATAIGVAGEEVVRHLGALESWVAGLGAWSLVAFVALLVAGTTVFVPVSLLSILAGVLFGFELGTLAVVVGYLLGALLQYELARRGLRARVQRLLASRPSLLAIQAAVLRREFGLQVLLRLTPLNPATANYMLGASGVRLGPYLLASLVHVPSLALEVYLGYAGRHAARLAESGSAGLHLRELSMIVALCAGVSALVIASRLARKAIAGAVAADAAAVEATRDASAGSSDAAR